MLTINQYQILNSCANGYELFYYPFAEINYGGQVFSRSDGDNCRQYADDQKWVISVPSETVVEDIIQLIENGFLDCKYTSDHTNKNPASIFTIANPDFSIYSSYNCLLFNDHIEQLGYGPYEFKTTEVGIAEIDKSVYEAFDK